MIHTKTFNDAYSQLREYFFLDLLNQHGASVPKIFTNDIAGKSIRMEHGGDNLFTWLQQNRNPALIIPVVLQALKAVGQIASVGVLHLDVALRNFVVAMPYEGSLPQVRMIDFGLAISPLLPLQKPLWIYPHLATQHPLLCDAITQDWQDFFQRNDLSPPNDWHYPFEVSHQVYSADWCQAVRADALCGDMRLLAHAMAYLLEQVQQVCAANVFSVDVIAAAKACTGLMDLPLARQRIDNLMAQLAGAITATPRPTMIQAPAPISRAVAPERQFSQNPERGLDEPPRKVWSHSAASLSLGVLICIIAFAQADSIYRLHRLVLSPTGFWVLIGCWLLWLVRSLVALVRPERLNRLVSSLIFPGTALIYVSLELWSIHRLDWGQFRLLWGSAMVLLGIVFWSRRSSVK